MLNLYYTHFFLKFHRIVKSTNQNGLPNISNKHMYTQHNKNHKAYKIVRLLGQGGLVHGFASSSLK